MPEKYDDEDEVGTGLYVLIGCAAVTGTQIPLFFITLIAAAWLLAFSTPSRRQRLPEAPQ